VKWWELTIRVPLEAADTLSTVLQTWSEVQGVSLEGNVVAGAPHPEFGEFVDDALLAEEQVLLRVYLPDYVEKDAIYVRALAAVETVNRCGLDIADAKSNIAVTQIDESVWEDAWKSHYHTMDVGARFVIVPKWEDTLQNTTRMAIILEPGMAFGTGSHATTQLCLEALEDTVSVGCRVLDIGCGTAVLAIGAARLGATAIIAIDVDPVAVNIARQNILENQVETAVQVLEGDLLHTFEGAGYDLVVANILRDAVIALTPQAFDALRPGGRYLSSGFVTSQQAQVEKGLLQHGFVIEKAYEREDWVAILAVKPS